MVKKVIKKKVPHTKPVIFVISRYDPYGLKLQCRYQRREEICDFFDFLFSAGGLVLEMYSFGILRGFVAQYLELKILVFLMEAFSKKNEEKGVGVKKKIVL